MTVRDVRLSAGAGFVVVIMGSIMTMPGLPKKPAARTSTWTKTAKSPDFFNDPTGNRVRYACRFAPAFLSNVRQHPFDGLDRQRGAGRFSGRYAADFPR